MVVAFAHPTLDASSRERVLPCKDSDLASHGIAPGMD